MARRTARGFPIVTAIVAASTALAQPGDTPFEGRAMGNFRVACGEDMRRFCAGVMPGEGRIIQCLTNYRSQLSAACRADLAGAGSRMGAASGAYAYGPGRNPNGYGPGPNPNGSVPTRMVLTAIMPGRMRTLTGAAFRRNTPPNQTDPNTARGATREGMRRETHLLQAPENPQVLSSPKTVARVLMCFICRPAMPLTKATHSFCCSTAATAQGHISLR